MVLTGGGSRSAYQVGCAARSDGKCSAGTNPFQVIVGSSAGGIAAAVLPPKLTMARAVLGLERVWATFIRPRSFTSILCIWLRAGLHWVLALASGGVLLSPPRRCSTIPVARAVGCACRLRVSAAVSRRGHLRAFALCATSYVTGNPLRSMTVSNHQGLVAYSASAGAPK